MTSDDKNLVIAGLGPHTKRIYIQILKSLDIYPKLIIDIESARDSVKKFLRTHHINCDLYFVPDKNKDLRRLSEVDKCNILNLLNKNRINKAIISTEPKAHVAYAEFFLQQKITVLMDKPVTAIKNACFEDKSAQLIYKEYKHLRDLSIVNDAPLVIQSQRRYHSGYIFIRELIKDNLLKYGVPITHIDIYHCDGQWNMPTEYLTRENHSFHHGYGKVFHSGYHFIDLMSWILTLNNLLPDKKPNCFTAIHKTIKPQDQLFHLNDSYVSLFGKEIPKLHQDNFNIMGELDSYSILQFKRNERVVTTANLNLLHSGFSRRAWPELANDVYKGNGRVRHERVNIQIGPIFNIQVHSYQSYEIKDSVYSKKETEPGGLDHFDIYIFRNSELIGGKPFEKIRVSNKNRLNRKTHMGHNEEAREKCTVDWLQGNDSENDVLKHKLSNLILSTLYRCSAKESAGKFPQIEVSL
ncbi:MAG: hypothetical protein UT05_C0016G0009 [Parcubacteria group bacterium GW2011_GWF2_38_76]|nr:MAG: hypothetical protein UT05_C0016G0009 [Parcubacteria group bacterium GW2011_GWF2_38_76]